MATFYTLSPSGCPENPVLFPTIRPTFIAAGHGFTDNPQEADCFLIDLHSRLFPYEQSVIDYIVGSGKPLVTFDEWDRGGMSREFWPHPLTSQQAKVFDYLPKVKELHFCRLLDKTKERPPYLYPYEKPIFNTEEPIRTPDELFNRPYDIFFVANSAPQRETIKRVFEQDGRFRCNIVLGAAKIPFNEWKDMAAQSKAFLKISGGGYSCERLQALWAHSLMIMEDTDQLLAKPFTQALNCLKIQTTPRYEELTLIHGVLNNKELLYNIYQAQYNFVKKYYCADWIANDMLDKIKKHGLI